MEDLGYSVLTGGDHILFWVLATVGAFAARLILGQIKAGKIREVVGRALSEIGDAVLEVGHTYVDALKAASADGKLTAGEKAKAKADAIAKAKANIGTAGLKRLATILGLNMAGLDGWLGTKLEAAVATMAPSGSSTATVKVGEIDIKATTSDPQ